MRVMRVVAASLCGAVLSLVVFGLGAGLAASSTVLDADFVTSEMEAMDIHLLFADEAKKLVPPGADFLFPVIDEAASDLEPWAKEQAAKVVQAAFDFINERQEFRVVISLEEPKDYLVARLAEVLQTSLPPGFPQVPADQMDAFLGAIEREVDARIPDSLVIDGTFAGEEVMGELRTAQRYTGYVRTGLRVLPVVAVLAILLIALMQRWRARLVSRYVGSAFIAGGAAGIIVVAALRAVLPERIGAVVPSVIASALPGFIDRSSQPLLLYGVIVLLVGIDLVLLSILLRPAES